jgi:hypothetical protein
LTTDVPAQHTCSACCGRGVLVLKDGAEVDANGAARSSSKQQTDVAKERCVV